METGDLFFEKRKHPRIQVSLAIEYKVVNETDEYYATLEKKRSIHNGDSKDISSEGLFLMSDKCLEKGDILKIEMMLPDEDKPVRAFAEIIWLSDHSVPEGRHGAGIYFMALRDEDADRIGRLVANMLKLG
jgi:hypothetical protein